MSETKVQRQTKVHCRPKPLSASVEALAMSAKTIYTLPKKTSENIVDLMLKIMNAEGPRPMRNMRPAKKTRTGADNFYVEHHAEYEAMCPQSSNKADCVNTHNSAYPKMYDELNKRHSIANASPSEKFLPSTTYDPNCRICARIKKREENLARRKRANPRTKYNRNYRKNNRNYRKNNSLREVKTKISKPRRSKRKNQSSSRLYKLGKSRMSRGCQFSSCYSPAQRKSMTALSDGSKSQAQDDKTAANNLGSDENYETRHVVSPILLTKKTSKKQSKSDVDSRNPETSAPSVSSYNSYLSMDHEPMVE